MTAQQLRNSILQQAIQGRLVPQDPNDEPASVLLERIRKEKEQLVKEGKLKKKDLATTPIADDEKPFDIPSGWEWCRLGTLIYLLSGQDLTPDRYTSEEGGIPYITGASCFIKGKLLLNRWTTSPTSVSHYGDLLITCKGTVGTMAYNQIGDIHIARQIMAISSKYMYLPYIQYFLEYMVPNLEKQAHSIIPGISRDVLLNLPIPLPPLAEQRRIVAKIEELMPLVEKYGKAQTELDTLNQDLPRRLRQSVLQQAIQGKLVSQDKSDGTGISLYENICKHKEILCKSGQLKSKDVEPSDVLDEEIPFDIPESWKWCHMGDLISMRMGKTPPRGDSQFWSNANLPWVSISDMKDYGHVKSTKEYVSQYAADHAFKEISPVGSLLMSFKLTVGRTSILEIPAYHNEAIITINPYVDDDYAFRNYLFYLLPVLANLGDSKDAIKGKTLNSTSLYNLLIPLPPLNEQRRIVAKIEELFAEIDKLK